MGKQSKRHILKRAGRAVEQLEDVKSLVYPHKGGGIAALKGRIRFFAGFGEEILSQFAQILSDNERGAFGIAHADELFYLPEGNFGKSFGHEKPAVSREPPYDRLGARRFFVSSCTDKIHCFTSLYF